MFSAPTFGDRHFVVVEHYQQIGFDIASVVHRFKRHSRGYRPVADHADRAALLIFFGSGDGYPDAGGDGGRRVADAQDVILAFSAPREGVQTAFLADSADPIAASGQNFMWVSTVADVPD